MAKKIEKVVEPTGSIFNYNLEDIMGDRFGKYAKYIIQDRALPDVRDGLKPVQRRVLFAMYMDNNVPSKPYRKSAKTVGAVIANYHPHGDTSVYDAMVRMSQWWKQNLPLVDMQGNNGSIDDDPAAAMRYTEARLAPISMELLRDIDKDTVPFALNFDDTSEEPTVLPSRFPNILVNGAKGIAAGYATSIPPHNLGEVIQGCLYRIKNPNCSLEEVMEYIPGPDFPTGAIISGKEGIIDAFKTGSGQVQVNSKYELKKNKNYTSMIISEIPFEVVKSQLVARIAKAAVEKEVEGIIEVRDESDRNGLSIVIDMKNEADHQNIINYLMKKTDLSVKYSYNVIAICNKRPVQLGLLSILDYYIAHQIEVIDRRTAYDLKISKDRLHIVEGLMIAVANIKEVVDIILKCKDKKESKTRLIERFKLSETQAEAIVMLHLYRLSSTNIEDLQNEFKSLSKTVAELESLLHNDKKLRKKLCDELTEVYKAHPSKRLSTIEDEVKEFVIEKKAVIKEEVRVSITRDAYFKRSSIKSYVASGEDSLPAIKSGDIFVGLGNAFTTDTIIAFTDKGNYLYVPVYELIDNKWKDEGKHISHLISLSGDEKIVAAFVVDEFKDNLNLLLCSKFGNIKRTPLNEFVLIRYTKPGKAINLLKDDALVSVDFVDGDSKVVVTSNKGKCIMYHESLINLIGPKGSGVKAITLKDDDEFVTSAFAYRKGNKGQVVSFTNKGGLKVFNPANLSESNGRTKKTSDIYKYYVTDPHHMVNCFIAHDEDKFFVLSNIRAAEPLDVDTSKTTPLGKSIKSSLLINPKEEIRIISTYNLPTIGSKTKLYKAVEKKIEEDVVETKSKKEEKKEESEQLSFLNYINDL